MPHFKQLYDERIIFWSCFIYKIFPSLQEIFIYENKRSLYPAEGNNIPHPKTDVFYSYGDVLGIHSFSSIPICCQDKYWCIRQRSDNNQIHHRGKRHIDEIRGKGLPTNRPNRRKEILKESPLYHSSI